jgi:hypothetical protein
MPVRKESHAIFVTRKRIFHLHINGKVIRTTGQKMGQVRFPGCKWGKT